MDIGLGQISLFKNYIFVMNWRWKYVRKLCTSVITVFRWIIYNQFLLVAYKLAKQRLLDEDDIIRLKMAWWSLLVTPLQHKAVASNQFKLRSFIQLYFVADWLFIFSSKEPVVMTVRQID